MPCNGSGSDPLDEFLHRLFSGAMVDARAFLRANPGLPDDERDLVMKLCLSPVESPAEPNPVSDRSDRPTPRAASP